MEAAGFGKVDWDPRVSWGHFLITVTLHQITRPRESASAVLGAPSITLFYSLGRFMWPISLPFVHLRGPISHVPGLTGHRACAAALSE